MLDDDGQATSLEDDSVSSASGGRSYYLLVNWLIAVRCQ